MSLAPLMQREERAHCLALLERGGPGVHAYVLHKARALEAAEPDVHQGLTRAVTDTLGPHATAQAEREIKFFTQGRGLG